MKPEQKKNCLIKKL